MFFLWIPSSQLAVERIKGRVREGGHNIPVKDVKRRFHRSIYNFFKTYRLLLDTWMFFNNAKAKPELIAQKINNHIDVIDEELFERILKETGVKL